MPERLDLHLVDNDGLPVPGALVTAEVDPPLSFTTDAGGLAVIELPEIPRHLAVRVRRNGFVPQLVVWDLKLVGGALPERYTLKFDRAHTIGGVVHNQRGEPVAGAQVLVTLGGRSRNNVQPRTRIDIYETPVETDAAGRWQFKEAPAKFEHLYIRLAHPDYLSRHYSQAQPSVEDCQRGTAVLVIPDGIPCEGTVTDEFGQPIAGAKVIVGEGGNGSDVKDSRRTDAQGRFRFGGISFENYSEPQILSFNKKGFAPELVTLEPSTTLVRVNAIMKPGRKLSVRFTDEEGVPVSGVTLSMSCWRSHRPFHRHFQSDANGLAVWEDAPHDAVGFWILKDGFQGDEQQLTAAEGVQTIILHRPRMISGCVIDARTRQPIPHFSLIYGERRNERTFWNRHWIYPFENGAYRTGAGDKVITRNRDGSICEEGARFLRVEAPGYRAAVSRPIANDEMGDMVFDFELEPAEDISGIVRDAQGRPVAGVEIAVVSGERPISVRNGKVHDRGHHLLSTGADGRYVLAPQEEDHPIVFTHPRAGYCVTSCSELKASPDIALRRWARVELLTTSGPDEVSNYTVEEKLERGAPRSPVRFMCSGVRASEGVLLFETMPGGEVRLFIGRSSLRRDQFTLVSGETLRLDRRTGRRSVVGRLALPPHGITSHPNFADLHVKRPLRRGLPAEQVAEHFFEVPFEIDLAGKFRVDDLDPGHYEVRCTFYRAAHSREKSDIAGVAREGFELPPGDGPFDLGVIPVA